MAGSRALARPVRSPGNPAAPGPLEQLQRRYERPGIYNKEIQLPLLAMQRGRWQTVRDQFAVAMTNCRFQRRQAFVFLLFVEVFGVFDREHSRNDFGKCEVTLKDARTP